MLTGSCLCGAVRYEIDAPVADIVHCHCHTCRKAHGTLYGSSAMVRRADFKLTEGAEALIGYQSSQADKPADEFRRVKVAVDRKGVEAKTISGYFP